MNDFGVALKFLFHLVLFLFPFILVQSNYNDGHLTWAKFCKVQTGQWGCRLGC